MKMFQKKTQLGNTLLAKYKIPCIFAKRKSNRYKAIKISNKINGSFKSPCKRGFFLLTSSDYL